MAERWDQYGLRNAWFQARESKDPSTWVGAVILRPDNTIAATGWNGFPRGVTDSPERLNDRDVKLMLTIHAEENAILTAHEPLKGYTLYVWPFEPCAGCAAKIIQAGISRVVAPKVTPPERWKRSFDLSASILREAGVVFDAIEFPLPDYCEEPDV